MRDVVADGERLGSLLLDVLRMLAAEAFLVLALLGDLGGTGLPADFGHAEDWLPALKGAGAERGRIAKAGGDESTLSPAVVDAGNMPVHLAGRGVAVELVADVDEMLDGRDVDVIDGGEVENDGL